MTLYSQRDVKWKGYLGNSKTDFNNYGCKCTSFAIIDGRTPREMNDLFVAKGAFSGDFFLDQKCADALGWTFLGVKTKPEGNAVIIEVDMSPSPGKQQHFVVHDGNLIIDPWTGTRRDNSTYPIINYRCFNKPLTEESMQKEFVEAVESVTGEKYGANINEKEQKDAAGKLKEVKAKLEWCNQLELTNKRLLENNEIIANKLAEEKLKYIESVASVEEMKKTVREYTGKAGICEPALKTCQENLRVQSEKAKEGIEVYGAIELLVQAVRKMLNK